MQILLASCRADSGSPARSPSIDRESTTTNSAPTPALSGELTDDERALLRVLQVVVGSGNRQTTDAMARAREAVVAECMNASGFDYVAATYEPRNQHFPPTPARTDDFMLEYGYGVASLISQRDASTALRSTPDSEPNLAYLDGLGPAEREAYQRPHYGDGHLKNDGMYVPADPFGGCNGQGVDASVAQLGLRARISQTPGFQRAVGELHQASQADPDVVEATMAWSECMAEAGYDLKAPDDAVSLVDWLGRLSPSAPPRSRSPALSELGAQSRSPRTETTRVRRSREVELTTVDLTCDQRVGLQLSRDRALLGEATDFIDRWLIADRLGAEG